MARRLKQLVVAIIGVTFASLPLSSSMASASPVISEYTIPTTSAEPYDITAGSDGSMWFTESYAFANKIGKVSPNGAFTEYNIPGSQTFPLGITNGPDNALWFCESGAEKIGRITTSGSLTEYSVPSHPSTGAAPISITTGSDGALWFTENASNRIGRVNTTGSFTEYTIPTSNSGPFGIASGPDGNLWFTEKGTNKIGKMTTSGTFTEYSVPTSSAQPNLIVAGPDGALWFTEVAASKIGRITTSGSFTEYSLSASSSPYSITSGTDNSLWFTEQNTNKIGQISTGGSITEYNIPTSNSFPRGVKTDSSGNVWFGEYNGNKIGKISLAPLAPSNLSISSPTQNPNLSWTGVSGATSYNIYRNNTLIDTISSSNTTYTDYQAPEGNNSYYVTAVNSGGESSHSNTVSVLVDRTNPTISSNVTYVTDTNGKNTGNVKVTFTCNDNTSGSGVASCTSPVTVDNEGIGHTVDGTATDNAGNSTTIHVNASQLVTAINAGGNDTGNYVTDTDVTGGTQYSSNAAVDTSNATIQPAPQDVYQSTRYGNMTYTVPNLTPNANYTLRLHFNEVYWGAIAGSGGTGSRVFNVDINGQPALTNFDIFEQAGGANIAIAKELPVTADSNGNVVVDFSNVTDNALVSGLELYKGDLPPQPNPPTVTSALINTGGDTQGSFVNDVHFSGGTTYTTNASVDTSDVTNPAPDAVYQSTRYGNFTYTIPYFAPNTNVHVRLHFNEVYWGTDLSGNQGGDGSRLFNVSINGTQVLNNFDIFQTAGGANKAIAEDFDTTTDSFGRVTIQFTTVTDNALVSGIEVE